MENSGRALLRFEMECEPSFCEEYLTYRQACEMVGMTDDLFDVFSEKYGLIAFNKNVNRVKPSNKRGRVYSKTQIHNAIGMDQKSQANNSLVTQ